VIFHTKNLRKNVSIHRGCTSLSEVLTFSRRKSLRVKEGDLKNQSFPLNSYPKVACMDYSKQSVAFNILILDVLLFKLKKVLKNIYIF
jgi:hypothetical protein